MIDTRLADDAPAATNRNLRQFAALWLLLFGALALSYGNRQSSLTAIMVFAGLAGLGGVGLIWPAAIRPVFVGAMVLTYPLGWVMSHLLLALLFYGVFTPVALFFRLTGRDAMKRQRRPRDSHWVAKPAAVDLRSYFRQS